MFSAAAASFSRSVYRTFSTNAATSPPAVQSPADKSLHIFARLKAERHPEKLLSLFKANATNHLLIENRFAFRDAVNRLAAAGRRDLVENLLEHQITAVPALIRRQAFMSRVILLYGMAGMPEHAIRTFRQIPAIPTVKSFNAVLTALLASMQTPDSGRSFEMLQQFVADIPSGVCADLLSYNIMIKAFCNMQMPEKAYLMMLEMEKTARISPDVVSYTTILSAFYKIGLLEIGDGIWNRMVMKGIWPNAVTFNCRLECLINRRKNWQARNMVMKMGELGITADHFTYNLLIKGFGKAGNLEMAKKIYLRMRNDGLEPNLKIYQTMIHYLSEGGEFILASRLCEESMMKNWHPSFDTIRRLVDWFAKDPDHREIAERLVELAKKKVPRYLESQIRVLERFLCGD